MIQITPIGAFTACYVGLYGQTTPLSQLVSVRTEGAEVGEDLPTDFVLSLDSPVQSGNHIVRVTLSFLSTSKELTALVRGLLPGASDINTPIGQTQYSLMLVTGIGQDNYYFPQVRTEKTYKRTYSKKSPTVTSIVFIAEKRDVTVNIINKGTLAELSAIMTTAYPL